MAHTVWVGAAVAAVGTLMGAHPAGQPAPPASAPNPVRPAPGRRPARAPDGPWNHEVWFATSSDGLEFHIGEEALLRRASVPEVIELARALPGAGEANPAGALLIYIVDGRESDRGSPPGREGLARLRSIDGGKTWSEAQTVRVTGWPSDGPGGVPVDPALVQLDDGRLRLYFYRMEPGGEDRPGIRPVPAIPPTGPRTPGNPGRPAPGPTPPGDGPPAGGPAHEIRSAVSDDGLTFVLEEGVRFEGPGLTDPAVVRLPGEDGQWLMFLSRGESTVLTRSRDGLGFESDERFRLGEGGVPGAVVRLDGTVRVYVTTREGIRSAVFDPVSGALRPDEGRRVEGPCGDPSVRALRGGGYVLAFKRFMETPERRP